MVSEELESRTFILEQEDLIMECSLCHIYGACVYSMVSFDKCVHCVVATIVELDSTSEGPHVPFQVFGSSHPQSQVLTDLLSTSLCIIL